MGNLRIGTSGWNYPSGQGTWNGIFYPPAKARPKGFDELGFYSEHFDTVEVNSTFYGQPRASVTRTWAERTPRLFEFSVKLYQKFTHPKMYEQVLRRSLHTPEGHEAAVRELVKPSAADLDEFRRGIEPLASAGKLGAVLVQFPPTRPRDDGILRLLLDSLDPELEYAFEFRHESWAGVDVPVLLNSFEADASFRYFRLREPPYDDETLRGWALRFRPLLEDGMRIYCYFKHEDEPSAPRYAQRLLEFLR